MARNKAGFQIGSLESGLLIAAGRIDGLSAVRKRGVNLAVGTSYEDLWLPGGSLLVLPSATILEVASSSTADTSAGTGARTLQVEGYDTDHVPISETIIMTGRTLVNTVGVFAGINSVRVLTAGTGGVNAGDIYLANDDGSWTNGVPQTADKIQAKIAIGYGQTQTAIHTVPAGFTAYLTGLYIDSAPGKTITYRLVANDLANDSEVVEIEGIVADSAGFPALPFPYLAFAEKTTIRLTAKVSATTAIVTGGYDLIMLDNSKL